MGEGGGQKGGRECSIAPPPSLKLQGVPQQRETNHQQFPPLLYPSLVKSTTVSRHSRSLYGKGKSISRHYADYHSRNN